MANKKFSEFVLKTSTSDVSHIVGYNGAENVQITPANFVTSGGTGVFLPLAGGTMTGTNGVVFPDNFYLNLGTSSDFEIYHDGNNSYLKDQGTGELILASNGTGIKLEKTDGEKMIHALTDGAVELYFDSVKKLETTLLGATVTGDLLVTGTITGTGGSFLPLAGGTMVGNTTHNDNVKSIYGSPGNDLQIYHDGLNSYIQDTGTGGLIMSTNLLEVYNATVNEFMIVGTENGAVDLYYNGSKKLETTNLGVSVTGDGVFTGSITANSGSKITSSSADTTFSIETTSGTTIFPILDFVSSHSTVGGQIRQGGAQVIGFDKSLNSTFGGDVSLGNVKKLKFGLSSDASLQWNNTNNEFEINTGADASEISITAGTTNTYTSEIQIGARSSAQGEGIFFKTRSAEKMRLDGSGNLGIGVTAPYQKTVIGGHLGFTTATAGTDFTGDVRRNGIGWQSTNGTGNLSAFINSTTVGAWGGTLNFFTRGSGSGNLIEAMNISSTGNVGIGTSTPDYRLHVSGAEDIRVKVTSTNNSSSGIFFTSTNGGTQVGTGTIATSNTGDMKFFTGTTSEGERMRISSGGDVLVGKTSADFLTAGIELRTSGQLNVSVNADSFNFYNPTASVYRFFVSAAGQINATSTSINAISDVTLKENIKPLETGLKEVMKLQPRRFDWKNGDGKNIAGFIAQEVEEILPDLVSDYKYNDNETKKSLKMGDMIPTLVKSIQELKAEIELLKNK